MIRLPAEQIEAIAVLLLDAAGSPHEESVIVSEILVRSNLAGHDSHGVMRVPQYVLQIREGSIRPGAPFEIVRDAPAFAVVDGHQGWGPVIGRKAMDMAIAKARQQGTATVAVRGSAHLGRIGEYPLMAARAGMIGLLFVNSRGCGTERVVPFGGIDRRFTPDPLAFAAPAAACPVLVDITTSTLPEGKVRLAFYTGQEVPAGCMIDAEGNEITDPAVFYGQPGGALLPLGGLLGHKGTGLAVMNELMAGALSNAGCNGEMVPDEGNGALMQVINTADFLPVESFVKQVEHLRAWVKSSRPRPGVTEVLFPGEPEFRTEQQRRRDGIPLDESLMTQFCETADDLGIEIPLLRPGGAAGRAAAAAYRKLR